MRKGFTLIELLAVITVLAIITLIATPIVLNIIEDSKKTAYKNEVYSIIRAAHLYNNRKQIEGQKLSEEIIGLDNNQTKLDVSTMPGAGEMKITEDGEITLAINNGRYCARKIVDRDEVVITEDVENCILPVTLKEVATISEELGVTSIDNCMLNGICEPGTAFAIKVNDNEVKKFYVLGESEDEVTLIMSENTSSGVWDTYTFITNGPLNALSLLKHDTDSWINIPERNYVTTDQNNNYPSITQKMRTKLLTKQDVEIVCEYGCPTYLKGSYWLATTKAGYAVYRINGVTLGSQNSREPSGVRPVITLVKNRKKVTLVNELELETNDVTTLVNASFIVNATILPNEANNKQLKWSSNNTNIVEVTQDGIITGKSAGTAKLYVETIDGSEIKKEININVQESKKLSEIATISEELEVLEINNCATSGICELGTPFVIRVNDDEIYKFYVIKDDGINVTMIMNKNLVATSIWANNNNTQGPLVALSTLKNATNLWSNISVRPYTFKDDGKIHVYPQLTVYDARARLLTFEEATSLGCSGSSCPSYLTENTNSYWLSSTENASLWSLIIKSTGTGDAYGNLKSAGIRPVITLSK